MYFSEVTTVMTTAIAAMMTAEICPCMRMRMRLRMCANVLLSKIRIALEMMFGYFYPHFPITTIFVMGRMVIGKVFWGAID